MSIKISLIAELKHESTLTRKMLERVPLDKKDWKPHEKSMTIGRLATHVAENTNWVTRVLSADEFNFATHTFKPHTAASTEELLQIFDSNLNTALTNLENTSDEDYDKIWSMKAGEKIMQQLPKKIAIRNLALSHIIHHRGQLSVYLRLLDIPVPGMYGPSADER